jgi:hypothetical protein
MIDDLMTEYRPLLLKSAIGLLFWALAGQTFAAEAASEPQAPGTGVPETGEPADATPSGADAGQSAEGPSAEVFIPTEEISEDFAVSFPVDI